MGSPDEDTALTKDGVEAHLQELLAEQPAWCGEGLRLVRREWPTDIGPVDLMCRDADDEWVAVEIKRVAGIEAVEQLTRYLERIRLDPAFDVLPRRAGRADDQAAGLACSRARAGSRASRSTWRSCVASASRICDCSRRERRDDAVLHRAPRAGPPDHDQPPRPAQRGQRRRRRGDRRRARRARRRRRAVGRRPHRRRQGLLRRHGPEGVRGRRAAVRRGPRLRRHHPARGRQAADRRGRGVRASPAGSRSRWPAT